MVEPVTISLAAMGMIGYGIMHMSLIPISPIPIIPIHIFFKEHLKAEKELTKKNIRLIKTRRPQKKIPTYLWFFSKMTTEQTLYVLGWEC